jgi:hypothetical protein
MLENDTDAFIIASKSHSNVVGFFAVNTARAVKLQSASGRTGKSPTIFRSHKHECPATRNTINNPSHDRRGSENKTKLTLSIS